MAAGISTWYFSGTDMKSYYSRCSQNNSISSSFSQPWPPSPFPSTQIESQPSCHQFALQLSSIPHEKKKIIKTKIASLKNKHFRRHHSDSSVNVLSSKFLRFKVYQSYITNHKSSSKISSKHSIKLQLQNLNQTSVSKSWPNFTFKFQHSEMPWNM